MNNIANLSATKLVSALKSKSISSLELLEIYIERYKRLNPIVNAIVATDFEKARILARAADESLAKGEDTGPLHGLPMTVKDMVKVTGMPCTDGSPEFKDYIAPKDADLAQSLKNAGAIIFGKTNVSLFYIDVQTYNELYGQTNNPWDIKKTPGGSSGGSAAALSAGLTGLEIGSDIGGSIRIPAHFCGVYGHKPSYGIVSPHYIGKPLKGDIINYTAEYDLLVYGPLARSAEDLRLAMNIIVGSPSYQKKAIRIELPQARKKRLKEFKVGIWLDDKTYPIDSEVGNCLQNMTEQLKKSGVDIKARIPDIDLEKCYRLYNQFYTMACSREESEEAFIEAVSRLKKLKETDQSETAREIRALTAYHRDWHILNQKRAIMRQKWEDFFEDIDVLLCPPARIAAFHHDHTDMSQRILRINDRDEPYWEVMEPWISLSQVAYLPATIAPIGFTSTGLPVGVQIIGPYLEDNTTIEFARLMEEERISNLKTPPILKDSYKQ
ncbi:MAG: amidase [Desulfobacterales bacterium]|nr:amidase [Desulfobacterales bacterium]